MTWSNIFPIRRVLAEELWYLTVARVVSEEWEPLLLENKRNFFYLEVFRGARRLHNMWLSSHARDNWGKHDSCELQFGRLSLSISWTGPDASRQREELQSHSVCFFSHLWKETAGGCAGSIEERLMLQIESLYPYSPVNLKWVKDSSKSHCIPQILTGWVFQSISHLSKDRKNNAPPQKKQRGEKKQKERKCIIFSDFDPM